MNVFMELHTEQFIGNGHAAINEDTKAEQTVTLAARGRSTQFFQFDCLHSDLTVVNIPATSLEYNILLLFLF